MSTKAFTLIELLIIIAIIILLGIVICTEVFCPEV
jgi:competence protein ComGC